MRDGCRRSIGNGADTNIGGDAWLPTDENPYVQTELHETIFNAPVATLINEQAGSTVPEEAVAADGVGGGVRWRRQRQWRWRRRRALAGGGSSVASGAWRRVVQAAVSSPNRNL
nr:uncharacterized protein LOC109185242 [Ipomoea trifida]